MTSASKRLVRTVTRRDALVLLGGGMAGAAGALTVAGCGDGGGAAGDAAAAAFHGGTDYQVPPKGHFNLLDGVTDSILGDHLWADVLLTPGAMYRWAEKEWVPMLAESWNVDAEANTFTFTLRSGLRWSNDEPITSEDVLATYWCLRVMRNQLWNYLDGIEAVDDHTVKLSMSEPSTVVERYVLRQRIYSAADYGEFGRRAQELFDAGEDLDSPDGEALNEELQSFRPERLIVSGPFDFDYDSITNARLTMTKNPNGYAADTVAFDEIVIFRGETADLTPVVLSGEVDYSTHGYPVATEKQMVEQDIRIIRPPIYSGPALLFNLDELTEFDDPRARQAIAHAIDRERNGKLSLGDSGVGVELMAGFSDNLVPEWLSEEDQAKLNRYEYDPDAATALLTEAGWSKDGDTWMTPEGSPASYELIFPSEYVDWAAAGEDVVRQLNEFGLTVTSRGVTHTQQPIDVDQGNFQLAIQAWGTSAHPHPHFAFVQDLFTHNIPVAANQGGRGMGFELEQETSELGTVDLEESVVRAGQGLDDQEQRGNVTAVALAFNELLPMVPLFERYGNNPVPDGERVRGWPDDDDPLFQNSPYADNFAVMMIYDGTLHPPSA